jgi:hypothetical protein
MGDADDVIPPHSVAASRAWLRTHTQVEDVTLLGEGHMLTPRFARLAMDFTAAALR